MEAKRSRTRWTYAEFARLPSEGSTRYEVIDGELEVTAAPSRRHQRIVTRLVTALEGFVQEHGLGEVYVGPFDVLFAEGDYLEPDLLFVRADRLHVLSDRGVEGAPDLVIEVLSPATAARDRGVKLERYRHYGVPECWIVDPDALTVEVWRSPAAPDSPLVLSPGQRLTWRPTPYGPELGIEVGEVLMEES